MLSGIDAALSVAKSDNYTALQQLLKDHVSEWVTYPCVDGSFKKVYSLPGGNLALACFREKDNQTALTNGKELLTKEKQLLDFLQSIGLQTVNIHGEPFEINNQYAILMSWISDAHFIDVKDQEASIRKLISFLIGVAIPSGEGWVLRKNSIEAEISDKLAMQDFPLDQVKERAEKLHTDFRRIQEILAEHHYLIADLQLLINNHGVFIIDPIDVVSMKAHNSNLFEYRSVLDQSVQSNGEFVKLLYDGKRMLEQSIAFCHDVMSVVSQDELAQKILTILQAKELMSPRAPQSSLQKMLLIKSLGNLPTGTSSAISPRRGSSESPKTSPRRLEAQEALGSSRLSKSKNTMGICINSSTSMLASSSMVREFAASPEDESELCHSPTKENELNSPSKVLAFQFKTTKLSSSPPKATRRLFPEEQQENLQSTDDVAPKTLTLRKPN